VMWHLYFDDDANKGLVIKDVAAQFTEDTGIDVELSQVMFVDHIKRLLVAGAAQDKLPDVAVTGLAYPGLKSLVDAGQLLPLNDYITQEELDQYLPSLIKQVTFDDKIYALPQEVQVVALVPNGDLLDKLGISRETPETMEDLEAIFDQMLEADVAPVGLILGGGSFTAEWLFNILASRAITQEQMDAITAGEAKFTDYGMPVLETMERWATNGYFDPRASAMEWGATMASHYDQEIGVMGVGGFWPAQIKENEGLDDLDWPVWVTPPLIDDAPDQVAGGLWWGVSVNALGENPEAAARLVSAMTGTDFSQQWLERTFNLAAADADAEKVAFSPLGTYLDILQEYDAFWPDIPAGIGSDYGDVMVALVTGQMSAQDAGEQLDAIFADAN